MDAGTGATDTGPEGEEPSGSLPPMQDPDDTVGVPEAPPTPEPSRPVRHRVLAASEPSGDVIARIVADLRGDRAPAEPGPAEAEADWDAVEADDAEQVASDDAEDETVQAGDAVWVSVPSDEEDERLAAEHTEHTEHTEPEAEAEAEAEADDYETLVRSAEAVLDAVDGALRRLDDGTYGTCEACGGPIADDLLASTPTTATCERHLRPPGAA